MMSWFENQTRERSKFGKVENDLNGLIKQLVLKHLGPILGKEDVKKLSEFDLWSNMKRHLKGDGKALSLVIKDYFDGVERIIKKNSEVMGNIFYGYAKSKRMTDNAWDEQIVNNIKIKKVHLITYHPTYPIYKEEEIIEYVDSTTWPLKTWDASIDLEIYTRKVVAKEIGRKMKWKNLTSILRLKTRFSEHSKEAHATSWHFLINSKRI